MVHFIYFLPVGKRISCGTKFLFIYIYISVISLYYVFIYSS